jgi:hypothetical protein
MPSPDEVRLAILRRLSGAERIRIATEMSSAARELAIAGLQHRHPEWSGARVQQEWVESVRARSTGAHRPE